MGSQNGMTIQTMQQINRVVTCSRGAKVKGGISGREHHGFLGNPQKAPPLWEGTVWMDRVHEVCDIQTR